MILVCCKSIYACVFCLSLCLTPRRRHVPEGAERPHVLAEGLLLLMLPMLLMLLLGSQQKWQQCRGGDVLPQDMQPAPTHGLQVACGTPGLREWAQRAPASAVLLPRASVTAGQVSQQGA